MILKLRPLTASDPNKNICYWNHSRILGMWLIVYYAVMYYHEAYSYFIILNSLIQQMQTAKYCLSAKTLWIYKFLLSFCFVINPTCTSQTTDMLKYINTEYYFDFVLLQ